MALTPEQLAALPAWLQQMQAMQAVPGYGNSGYAGTGGYFDPAFGAAGRVYAPRVQSNDMGGENSYTGLSHLIGYAGTDATPWFEGKTYDGFDLGGKYTGSALTGMVRTLTARTSRESCRCWP